VKKPFFLKFLEKSACVKNPSPYNATPLRRQARRAAEQRLARQEQLRVLSKT